jgi:hypothetical protein
LTPRLPWNQPRQVCYNLYLIETPPLCKDDEGTATLWVFTYNQTAVSWNPNDNFLWS